MSAVVYRDRQVAVEPGVFTRMEVKREYLSHHGWSEDIKKARVFTGTGPAKNSLGRMRRWMDRTVTTQCVYYVQKLIISQALDGVPETIP